MKDHNNTFTVSDTYFSDVNGDGISDLVIGGRVLFGRLSDDNKLTYTSNSADTPVAVGDGAVKGDSLLADFNDIYEQQLKQFPLADAVRRWVAPYDGVVQITGDVHLIKDDSDARGEYKTADGVRVAIQENGSELWHQRIQADDYQSYTPGNVTAVPVHAGDRLYFRVQSIFDGKYDQVAWDPKISYLNVSATSDVNGLDPYDYQASRDFVYAGRASHVKMSYAGTVHLSGDIKVNGPLTDDVTLIVYKNDTVAVSRTLKAGETGAIRLDDDLTVAQGDTLRFRAKVDSPIDLAGITWSPQVVYTSAPKAGTLKDKDGNVQPLSVPLSYEADFYPGNDLDSPQQAWTAPQDGKLSVKSSVLLPVDDQITDGEVVFTVKKPGALLAKQVIAISDGKSASGGIISIDVKRGDKLYFDFSTRDRNLPGHLSGYKAEVSFTPALDDSFAKVPSAMHWAKPVTELAPAAYRGWSVIAYNGNLEHAEQPILDPLPKVNKDYSLEKARAYPFIPVPAPVRDQLPSEPHWTGPDEKLWIDPTRMSASRLGPAYIQVPRGSDYAGKRAVSRISKNSQDGISILIGSRTTGTSTSELDFLDMNGDRFPDVVGRGHIQFTAMNGGLEDHATNPNPSGTLASEAYKNARSSDNVANTVSEGSIASTISTVSGLVGGTTSSQGSDMPSMGFGGSIGGGHADA
ncbi:MAG TPA: sugar-binding protein, partial [Alphaproteobacteria bacterium]|nr:sugar-binding protein [Alphaproteobacteria bacterium]